MRGSGKGDKVKTSMETGQRWIDKESERPAGCIEMTRRTANSSGSGLVFVRISYFGNNPVKYTDPDGKIPQSYKVSNNLYIFSPSVTTLEGAASSLLGNIFPIPFVGGLIVDGINSSFGFKDIDESSSYVTLSNAAGKIFDAVSTGKTIADLAGNSSKLLGIAGKIATTGSYILAGIDLFNELTKTESCTA
jgi:hypothetical protein